MSWCNGTLELLDVEPEVVEVKMMGEAPKSPLRAIPEAESAEAASPKSVKSTTEARDDKEATTAEETKETAPTAEPEAEAAEEEDEEEPLIETFRFEADQHKELDFDANPSELFVMIQANAWTEALKQIEKAPEQAAIWISRKDAHGNLDWRILPIHSAIIFDAPPKVLQALLTAYPEGAKAMDDNGTLPLHLVSKLGRGQVLGELIVEAFPEAQDAKDDRGRTPAELAQARDLQTPTPTAAATPSSPSNAETRQELDFDGKPTKLFLAVHGKKWEDARTLAELYPKQAQIWISRHDSDGKLRWRLLPLHAAIIFGAPLDVVVAVLNAHPTAATLQDDQGVVPLHLAYKLHRSQAIVDVLLHAFPKAVDVQDHKGRTPMHYHASYEAAQRAALKAGIPTEIVEHSVAHDTKSLGTAEDAFSTQSADRAAAVQQKVADVEESYKKQMVLVKSTAPVFGCGANVAQLQESYKQEMEQLHKESDAALKEARLLELEASHRYEMESLKARFVKMQVESDDALRLLEGELNSAQETSQILVDHVEDLKEQLEKRADTERFLATKIANGAGTVEAAQFKEELEKLRKERDDLRKQLEDGVAKSKEVVSLRLQLNNLAQSETALSTRVPTLAIQLADAIQARNTERVTLEEQIRKLETERNELRTELTSSKDKLHQVGNLLVELSSGQDLIMKQAMAQEREIRVTALEQTKICSDVERQGVLLKSFDAERARIAEVTKRQQQELKEIAEAHERIFSVVGMHEKHVESACSKRGELVKTAGALKQKMVSTIESIVSVTGRDLIITEADDEERTTEQIVEAILTPKGAGVNVVQSFGMADEDEKETEEAESKDVEPVVDKQEDYYEDIETQPEEEVAKETVLEKKELVVDTKHEESDTAQMQAAVLSPSKTEESTDEISVTVNKIIKAAERAVAEQADVEEREGPEEDEVRQDTNVADIGRRRKHDKEIDEAEELLSPSQKSVQAKIKAFNRPDGKPLVPPQSP